MTHIKNIAGLILSACIALACSENNIGISDTQEKSIDLADDPILFPGWGKADTLEHYPVGPGVLYSKIQFPDAPLFVYVAKIDLTNPHNQIEQIQAEDKVPSASMETTSSQCKRNTYANHRVVCGVNHDFFSAATGTTMSINVSNGEIPSGSWLQSAILAFNSEKEAFTFHANLDARVVLPDNSSVVIDFFNAESGNLDPSHGCYFFNRFNARTLIDKGTYVSLIPQRSWIMNGESVPCKIESISEEPSQTSATRYVLFLRGEKATAFKAKASTGDLVSIAQKFTQGRFGEIPENITSAFHLYPSVAFGGKLHEEEQGSLDHENDRHPRTMIGISKDRKTVFLVVVEGRSTRSRGVTCGEVAEYLLSAGAWYVGNFDGGGSSAMVINNEMRNISSDGEGNERKVMDSFQVISTAPASDTETVYSFIQPTISVVSSNSSNTKVQLQLYSSNEYGDILSTDAKGFTFTCIPAELGSVDQNGVFTPGNKSIIGYIQADKNGKKAEIRVRSKRVVHN